MILSPRLSDREISGQPSRGETKLYRWLGELDNPGLQLTYELSTQTLNAKGTWSGKFGFLLFHLHHSSQVWDVKGGGNRLDREWQWWTEGNRGAFTLSTTLLVQIKNQSHNLLQAMQKAVLVALMLFHSQQRGIWMVRFLQLFPKSCQSHAKQCSEFRPSTQVNGVELLGNISIKEKRCL